MMIVQVELWQLISLLLAFFGAVGGFGKILLSQFEKRQAEQADHWDKRFTALEIAAKEWTRVERDFLAFKADLPMTFVMRDDYVRNQTVIEAKLDSVALRIENLQLKGAAK
jgi:hypothetical protein